MAMIENPFRPGAGHIPPYLAGRHLEMQEFREILAQDVILKNVVLTGLRGVGKTVLLETFKPVAREMGWQWVGTDLSESASVSEDNLATRLLADLAIYTSKFEYTSEIHQGIGFAARDSAVTSSFGYPVLRAIYDSQPGLTSDKLKHVLRIVGKIMPKGERMIFGYDEAQNLVDHAASNQYPLSVLLDVFQAVQKEGLPFLLVLAGLPTLFPKLVDARTYAERMFTVIFLKNLDAVASREAITVPISNSSIKIEPSNESIDLLVAETHGYPYFIQYMCRVAYDVWIEGVATSIPIEELHRKLDIDFFAGRWARASDRQRDLMVAIAFIDTDDGEFSVQEIVKSSEALEIKPFSNSLAHQMLNTLAEKGLVYKNRYGKYSFAVPLMANFIKRQMP